MPPSTALSNFTPGDNEMRALSLEEAFWAHVDKRGVDEWWPWLGHTRGTNGLLYGFLCSHGETYSAHRVGFVLQNGPIPDLPGADGRGTCVRHTCDFSLCMNGRHLIPGTHKQNMQDKVERNRDTRKNKTHCKHGHLRTPENLYQTKQGLRQCRSCHAAAERVRQARVRAQKEQR